MTLRERIEALHAAGATEVTVHPDGSVTSKMPPLSAGRVALEQRWSEWVKSEGDRQLMHVASTNDQPMTTCPERVI